jgi:NAD(P)-dependent dehydrogenase (short-subunit alcohol dehydrogenase family)
MSATLEGKVVVVTGCGSSGPGWGNGKAISVLFAREGANVFGCDINLAAAEETRTLICNEGGRCEVRVTDVVNGEQVKRWLRLALAASGVSTYS